MTAIVLLSDDASSVPGPAVHSRRNGRDTRLSLLVGTWDFPRIRRYFFLSFAVAEAKGGNPTFLQKLNKDLGLSGMRDR